MGLIAAVSLGFLAGVDFLTDSALLELKGVGGLFQNLMLQEHGLGSYFIPIELFLGPMIVIKNTVSLFDLLRIR